MNFLKESVQVAGAFVGVVVGAGFASGQEILQFFTSFGLAGLAGAVLSSALFIFLAMALSALGQKQAAESHKDVIHAICGRYLGPLVDALVTIFMLVMAVVMIAGGGALLEQLTGIPSIWGCIAVAVSTILIVWLDLRKVINLVCAVTPLLAIMVVIVAALAVAGSSADMATLSVAAENLPGASGHWLLAALLYVSYNIIAGAPFLIIMGGQTSNQKAAMWGGIFGGVLLGALMLLLAGSMFTRADELAGVAIPTLHLSAQSSRLLSILMAIAIFATILNTAVGVLYSFAARLFEPGTNRFRIGSAAGGLLAFAGSMFGFTQLIGTVYPFFGYLGFVLMASTLIGWLRLKSGKLTPQAFAVK
ncbi:membrane protein [Nitratireductor aestuarii]|uniref:Membrane protein n=1 Tax=Nitratireductor aestuarii TaxID=1735103 RepID=A0A916S232_9HYPH|nr:hypothetical protein [Nitratireductor aestuarii]GGA80044.1 membrane protein [Nitratireductor aestuarii]